MERRYLDWESAIRIVKEDHTINFFAKAATPWNALSIDALILLLQDKGFVINAFIMIIEHHYAGFLIDESFFVNSCSTYCFIPSQEGLPKNIFSVNALSKTVLDYYYFLLKPKGNNSIFYATYHHNIPDALVALNIEPLVNRSVIPCQSEEGVGAYMGTFDKIYPSFREIKSLGELRSYFRYVVCGRWFYRLLHGKFSSLTLKSNIFGLTSNHEVLPYYRKVFAIRCSTAKPQIDRDTISKSVVICTTAWRRSEIQDDEDLRVLKDVCDYLHTLGYSLLLKTHPRDSFFETQKDFLNCKILKVEGLSIEGLCAYCLPKAIISFSSTTLVNPKIFWNVPTFCLSNMLRREKISDFYLDEIDSFHKTFKKFVKFPNTVNELYDF